MLICRFPGFRQAMGDPSPIIALTFSLHQSCSCKFVDHSRRQGRADSQLVGQDAAFTMTIGNGVKNPEPSERELIARS